MGEAQAKAFMYYLLFCNASEAVLRITTGRAIIFFLVNRVEHQHLNQLPFGWVFVVQLGLRQTQVPYQHLEHYHHWRFSVIADKLFNELLCSKERCLEYFVSYAEKRVMIIIW